MTTKFIEDTIPLKIEDEYKRNEELKPEDVAQFRSWILSQTNFPKCVPDFMLALFLHSANYDIEEAKKHITSCLKLRSSTPEFFENRDPDSESLQTVWKLASYWVSKESTPENYQILYTGFLDSDATNYNFGNAAKAFLMVGEWFLLTNGSTPGIVVVMDAKGSTYKHLLRVKINLIMKFLSYIQEGLPVNIREIHIINVIPVIDKAMFLAKPFIKKELLDKLLKMGQGFRPELHLAEKKIMNKILECLQASIFFHPSSKLAEFYKKVPLEMLPADLGGKARTRQELQDEMVQGVRKMKEWFSADEKYLRFNNKMSAQNDEIIEPNMKSEEPEGLFHSLCID